MNGDTVFSNFIQEKFHIQNNIKINQPDIFDVGNHRLFLGAFLGKNIRCKAIKIYQNWNGFVWMKALLLTFISFHVLSPRF